MSDTNQEATQQSIEAVYQEACKTYHRIDDFRAKLLGFLPLVSGGGIILLLSKNMHDPFKLELISKYLHVAGIFGFMVQYKPGDYGYDDIHYSFKKNDGWSKAENIGEMINTNTFDFSPKVSPDGHYLYFSSRVNRDFNLTDQAAYTYDEYQNYLNSPLNGFGNIYRIKISKLNLK